MIIRELLVDSAMTRCHNTPSSPRERLDCICLTPLGNTVTRRSNYAHGLETRSQTRKYGSFRASTGTSSMNLLVASRMLNESAKLVRCTTATASPLEVAEHKSARPFFLSWMMMGSTKSHRRKMCDPAILSFIPTLEGKSHIQDSSCGAKRSNSSAGPNRSFRWYGASGARATKSFTQLLNAPILRMKVTYSRFSD